MINLSHSDINEKIKNAQKNWANGIINIGKCYLEKKDYIALTETFVEELYAFKKGKVLFKPTKASKNQFRKDKNEFISYFIGHNKISDEDKGFALEPWKDIQFDNFDFTVFKDIIISMGNYFFQCLFLLIHNNPKIMKKELLFLMKLFKYDFYSR